LEIEIGGILMRKAGALLPVASLPSNTGIGDFGKYAYDFVDKLEVMGMKIWQILPVNPLGYGNSPYQPYSSFAGDDIYINLQLLKNMGLIKSTIKPFNEKSIQIQYKEVREYKEKYLREAFTNFTPDDRYTEFVEMDWVYKYAVFIALKRENGYRCWNEWPKEHRDWIIDKKLNISLYEEEIQYQMFLQYIFYIQWMELKKYANTKGIKIMGDIPIYVGIDSLDVWSNQKCFLLNDKSQPTYIAGVPPDYFSNTGQRWGNPIYDWEYIKETDFKFWIERLAYNQKLFDILRIDHFRAFDTYWKIPVSCETAIDGEWVEAPGYELFDKVLETIKDIKIVVEDLGDLRPEVLKLRDHYNFKGMKIVQFSFDINNNSFEDRENMIIYSGTHDNQTIKGWYLSQTIEEQKAIKKYFTKNNYCYEDISHNFISYTLDNIAEIAIIPVQDIICLGDSGRINVPGTVGSPNWEWKLEDFKMIEDNTEYIKNMVNKSNR
jgi:4-alpha-glucanotransferase